MMQKGNVNMTPDDKPWTCKCGFLLGIVSPKNNTLRIKYKDLYLSISGETIKVTQLCRRCATPNVLSNTQEPPEVPSETDVKEEQPKAEEQTKEKEEKPKVAEKQSDEKA